MSESVTFVGDHEGGIVVVAFLVCGGYLFSDFLWFDDERGMSR